MEEEQSDYASYLLRLWKAKEHRRSVRLASLESTQTGQREYFHLQALVQFLLDRFGTSLDSSQGSESNIQPESPSVKEPDSEKGHL
jgi:hypothetical protein